MYVPMDWGAWERANEGMSLNVFVLAGEGEHTKYWPYDSRKDGRAPTGEVNSFSQAERRAAPNKKLSGLRH